MSYIDDFQPLIEEEYEEEEEEDSVLIMTF